MYYVLFETGNNDFLKYIANSFSEKIIQTIIALYINNTFAESDELINMDKVNEYFKINKKELSFSNCNLISNINCGNDACGKEHVFILASNQVAIFSHSMINNILKLTKEMNVEQQLNIQRILQTYEAAKIQNIKEIKTGCLQEHDKYLQEFIQKTNQLDNTQDYIYIRAKTNSDYNYFMENTKLLKVKECDAWCMLQE
jgi:hypothetical protein